MLILNFSPAPPLSPAQREQIRASVVRHLDARFAVAPLHVRVVDVPQRRSVEATLDACGLTAGEWKTLPIAPRITAEHPFAGALLGGGEREEGICVAGDTGGRKMRPTFASLFSGGEGTSTGARQAGLRHIWGLEIDDAIAQVARDNGFDVRTADVLQADPADYETPTVLHASPPCGSFSLAKQERRETGYDLALARATARFIERLRPRYFTLENVYGYRLSESWATIADALNCCGYWYDLAHVNAADFSVPQTRKRMIVRAPQGQMVPQLPPPEPWVGWLESIRDLLPTLPESQLAPWQLRGLRALWETTLINSAGYPDADGERVPVTRRADEPANTILANHAGRGMRAFIVDGAHAGRLPTVRMDDEPMFTIDTGGVKHPSRPFLVGGQYGQPANGGAPRPVQLRWQEEPAFTVTAQNKGDWRAWLARGKVMQVTPRALARFQAFPDEYRLLANKTLACRVIGMAVPPLLYQRIVTQLLKP